MSTYLERALADGHAALDSSGTKTRIKYVAVGRSEIYDDPEEQVRAEYWAELIYRYGYAPERIGVEITVPDRTPKDAADLVVFSDDERTTPWAVIECKRDGISDAEFAQAVEQAADRQGVESLGRDNPADRAGRECGGRVSRPADLSSVWARPHGAAGEVVLGSVP